MGIWQTIWQCIWKKYASVRGRASLGEFLSYLIFFVVFNTLWIGGIFGIMAWDGDVNLIDFTLGYVPFALLPPLVAVAGRRLHDASKSAWLLLLYLVPLINILALGLLFMPGSSGPNRFGAKPAGIR